MKKCLLIFFYSLLLQISFAQLGCKTTLDESQKTVKQCFHVNKKVSSKEIWDKDKRFGTLIVFNNQGVQLVEYNLREIGGHASAHLTYHTNGQVSKIEFSDAPDGGIQFYESTRKFDENGNQVDFHEMKYPLELEPTFIQIDPQEKLQQKVEPIKKQEVIACATIFQTVYQIENTTNAKLLISIEPVKNNCITTRCQEIILLPKEKIEFDTVLMADQFVSVKVYEPTVKEVLTKKRKSKKFRILECTPSDIGSKRTYYWVIFI